LLFAKSHKKICSLRGTESFHVTGVNTWLTPMLLITQYIKAGQNISQKN
jgi:hypothetical protein